MLSCRVPVLKNYFGQTVLLGIIIEPLMVRLEGTIKGGKAGKRYRQKRMFRSTAEA